MKKLKLDLDQIQVISFSPQPTAGGRRGTVESLEATIHIHCSEGCIPYVDTAYCDDGVFTWATCNNSCDGHCDIRDAPTPTGAD